MECTVRRGEQTHEGLVYWPHPETKPRHHQPATVIELLLPRLEALTVGDLLDVRVASGQALLIR